MGLWDYDKILQNSAARGYSEDDVAMSLANRMNTDISQDIRQGIAPRDIIKRLVDQNNQAFQPQAPAPDMPGLGGYARELGQGVGRGIGTLATVLSGLVTMPRNLVNRPTAEELQANKYDTSWMYLPEMMAEGAQKLSKDMPMSQQSEDNFMRRMSVMGVEGAVSMLPIVVGPALALGSVAGGAAIASGFAALGFGAAQFTDTYTKHVENGKSPNEATAAATLAGALTTGEEFVSDMILLGGARKLGFNPKALLSKSLKESIGLHDLPKAILGFIGSRAFEGVEEVGQDLTVKAIDHLFNVEDFDTNTREIVDTFVSSWLASLLVSAPMAIGMRQETKMQIQTINDPEAPMAMKLNAIRGISAKIASQENGGPTFSRAWNAYARSQVLQKKPIEIDENTSAIWDGYIQFRKQMLKLNKVEPLGTREIEQQGSAVDLQTGEVQTRPGTMSDEADPGKFALRGRIKKRRPFLDRDMTALAEQILPEAMDPTRNVIYEEWKFQFDQATRQFNRGAMSKEMYQAYRDDMGKKLLDLAKDFTDELRAKQSMKTGLNEEIPLPEREQPGYDPYGVAEQPPAPGRPAPSQYTYLTPEGEVVEQPQYPPQDIAPPIDLIAQKKEVLAKKAAERTAQEQAAIKETQEKVSQVQADMARIEELLTTGDPTLRKLFQSRANADQVWTGQNTKEIIDVLEKHQVWYQQRQPADIEGLRPLRKGTANAIRNLMKPIQREGFPKVQGINISSNEKGLGAALTNPTHYNPRGKSAKQKNNLESKYIYLDQGIEYQGKRYQDVEEAYFALKRGRDPKLLTDLIRTKLKTYPNLVKEIDERGGLEFLKASTHNVVGDKFWESTGEDQFMKSLREAYVSLHRPGAEPQLSENVFTKAADKETTIDSMNRLRDSKRLAQQHPLLTEQGKNVDIVLKDGSILATSYDRVVFGDHGPYIEMNEDQINLEAVPIETKKGPRAYYNELRSKDGSTMVYYQKKTVADRPNPPRGKYSVNLNRKEGYADYKVGKYYVSPDDIKGVYQSGQADLSVVEGVTVPRITSVKERTKILQNPNAVDIGRPPKYKRNQMHYGNPEEFGTTKDKGHKVVEMVKKFQDWLMGTDYLKVEQERRTWILQSILDGDLDNKILVCWVHDPVACHGDVLKKFIENKDLTRRALGKVEATQAEDVFAGEERAWIVRDTAKDQVPGSVKWQTWFKERKITLTDSAVQTYFGGMKELREFNMAFRTLRQKGLPAVGMDTLAAALMDDGIMLPSSEYLDGGTVTTDDIERAVEILKDSSYVIPEYAEKLAGVEAARKERELSPVRDPYKNQEDLQTDLKHLRKFFTSREDRTFTRERLDETILGNVDFAERQLIDLGYATQVVDLKAKVTDGKGEIDHKAIVVKLPNGNFVLVDDPPKNLFIQRTTKEESYFAEATSSKPYIIPINPTSIFSEYGADNQELIDEFPTMEEVVEEDEDIPVTFNEIIKATSAENALEQMIGRSSLKPFSIDEGTALNFAKKWAPKYAASEDSEQIIGYVQDRFVAKSWWVNLVRRDFKRQGKDVDITQWATKTLIREIKSMEQTRLEEIGELQTRGFEDFAEVLDEVTLNYQTYVDQIREHIGRDLEKAQKDPSLADNYDVNIFLAKNNTVPINGRITLYVEVRHKETLEPLQFFSKHILEAIPEKLYRQKKDREPYMSKVSYDPYDLEGQVRLKRNQGKPLEIIAKELGKSRKEINAIMNTLDAIDMAERTSMGVQIDAEDITKVHAEASSITYRDMGLLRVQEVTQWKTPLPVEEPQGPTQPDRLYPLDEGRQGPVWPYRIYSLEPLKKFLDRAYVNEWIDTQVKAGKKRAEAEWLAEKMVSYAYVNRAREDYHDGYGQVYLSYSQWAEVDEYIKDKLLPKLRIARPEMAKQMKRQYASEAEFIQRLEEIDGYDLLISEIPHLGEIFYEGIPYKAMNAQKLDKLLQLMQMFKGDLRVDFQSYVAEHGVFAMIDDPTLGKEAQKMDPRVPRPYNEEANILKDLIMKRISLRDKVDKEIDRMRQDDPTMTDIEEWEARQKITDELMNTEGRFMTGTLPYHRRMHEELADLFTATKEWLKTAPKTGALHTLAATHDIANAVYVIQQLYPQGENMPAAVQRVMDAVETLRETEWYMKDAHLNGQMSEKERSVFYVMRGDKTSPIIPWDKPATRESAGNVFSMTSFLGNLYRNPLMSLSGIPSSTRLRIGLAFLLQKKKGYGPLDMETAEEMARDYEKFVDRYLRGDHTGLTRLRPEIMLAMNNFMKQSEWAVFRAKDYEAAEMAMRRRLSSQADLPKSFNMTESEIRDFALDMHITTALSKTLLKKELQTRDLAQNEERMQKFLEIYNLLVKKHDSYFNDEYLVTGDKYDDLPVKQMMNIMRNVLADHSYRKKGKKQTQTRDIVSGLKRFRLKDSSLTKASESKVVADIVTKELADIRMKSEAITDQALRTKFLAQTIKQKVYATWDALFVEDDAQSALAGLQISELLFVQLYDTQQGTQFADAALDLADQTQANDFYEDIQDLAKGFTGLNVEQQLQIATGPEMVQIVSGEDLAARSELLYDSMYDFLSNFISMGYFMQVMGSVSKYARREAMRDLLVLGKERLDLSERDQKKQKWLLADEKRAVMAAQVRLMMSDALKGNKTSFMKRVRKIRQLTKDHQSRKALEGAMPKQITRYSVASKIPGMAPGLNVAALEFMGTLMSRMTGKNFDLRTNPELDSNYDAYVETLSKEAYQKFLSSHEVQPGMEARPLGREVLNTLKESEVLSMIEVAEKLTKGEQIEVALHEAFHAVETLMEFMAAYHPQAGVRKAFSTALETMKKEEPDAEKRAIRYSEKLFQAAEEGKTSVLTEEEKTWTQKILDILKVLYHWFRTYERAYSLSMVKKMEEMKTFSSEELFGAIYEGRIGEVYNEAKKRGFQPGTFMKFKEAYIRAAQGQKINWTNRGDIEKLLNRMFTDPELVSLMSKGLLGNQITDVTGYYEKNKGKINYMLDDVDFIDRRFGTNQVPAELRSAYKAVVGLVLIPRSGLAPWLNTNLGPVANEIRQRFLSSDQAQLQFARMSTDPAAIKKMERVEAQLKELVGSDEYYNFVIGILKHFRTGNDRAFAVDLKRVGILNPGVVATLDLGRYSISGKIKGLVSATKGYYHNLKARREKVTTANDAFTYIMDRFEGSKDLAKHEHTQIVNEILDDIKSLAKDLNETKTFSDFWVKASRYIGVKGTAAYDTPAKVLDATLYTHYDMYGGDKSDNLVRFWKAAAEYGEAWTQDPEIKFLLESAEKLQNTIKANPALKDKVVAIQKKMENAYKKTFFDGKRYGILDAYRQLYQARRKVIEAASLGNELALRSGTVHELERKFPTLVEFFAGYAMKDDASSPWDLVLSVPLMPTTEKLRKLGVTGAWNPQEYLWKYFKADPKLRDKWKSKMTDEAGKLLPKYKDMTFEQALQSKEVRFWQSRSGTKLMVTLYVRKSDNFAEPPFQHLHYTTASSNLKNYMDTIHATLENVKLVAEMGGLPISKGMEYTLDDVVQAEGKILPYLDGAPVLTWAPGFQVKKGFWAGKSYRQLEGHQLSIWIVAGRENLAPEEVQLPYSAHAAPYSQLETRTLQATDITQKIVRDTMTQYEERFGMKLEELISKQNARLVKQLMVDESGSPIIREYDFRGMPVYQYERVLYVRQQPYLHPDVYDRFKRYISPSDMLTNPILHALVRWNANLKRTILASSFFHHFSFMREWFFGTPFLFHGVGGFGPGKNYMAEIGITSRFNLKKVSPRGLEIYHNMLKHERLLHDAVHGDADIAAKAKEALKNFTTEEREMFRILEGVVRAGAGFGVQQEWDERNWGKKNRENALNLAKKNRLERVFSPILQGADKMEEFLFQKFGTGLKAINSLLAYKYLAGKVASGKYEIEIPDFFIKEMKNRGIEKDSYEWNFRIKQYKEQQIFKIVADYVNSNFGGLSLSRYRRSANPLVRAWFHPSFQLIKRFFLLAPDWTEANMVALVKLARHDVGKLEKALYWRFAGAAAARMTAAVIFMNIIVAIASGLLPGDEDEDEDEIFERLQIQWDRKDGVGEALISMWDVDVTPIYHGFGGEAKEMRKYFNLVGHFMDPMEFVTDPVKMAKNKLSAIGRMIFELGSGTNYKGETFTTISEVLGRDFEKGRYRSNTGTHKIGDPKWGKYKWKMTKFGPSHTVTPEQLLSYSFSQAKGVMPIQFQEAMNVMFGYSHWFESIPRIFGLQVMSDYLPDPSQDPDRYIGAITRRITDDFVKEVREAMEDGRTAVPEKVAVHFMDRIASRNQEAKRFGIRPIKYSSLRDRAREMFRRPTPDMPLYGYADKLADEITDERRERLLEG